jgi:hypothetical protein
MQATQLGIEIEPAEVRLQPKDGDEYRWEPILGREEFFRRDLFKRPLRLQEALPSIT